MKGKGNGNYLKYAIDQTYFYHICQTDVNELHRCLTQKQFNTYAKLVQEAWTQGVKQNKIKKDLVDVFFSSYINNPVFNQWYVSSGGICGYDPSNQATERSMEKIKGTSKCQGLMKIGQNMGTMIQSELPKMIYNFSTMGIGVVSCTQLQEEAIVLNPKSNIYQELTSFYNSIKESIDTRTIQNDINHKEEFLINTEEYVGKIIDDSRVQEYYLALQGITNETYKSRNKFIEAVSSLCQVTGLTSNNKVVYTGSCVRYCKTRYCPHSAFYQYHNKLISYGVIIPTHRTSYMRQSIRKTTPKSISKDRNNSIAMKLDTLKTIIFRIGSKYPQINKRMSQLPSVIRRKTNLDKKNTYTCSEKLDNANHCKLVLSSLII